MTEFARWGYKVFKSDRFWLNYPYTVALGSRVVAVSCTLWGARRAIRKDRKDQQRPNWWDDPLACQEDE
jgi:hypothetical protein